MTQVTFRINLKLDGTDHKYFRIPPPSMRPYTLQFKIVAGICFNAKLYTNYPKMNETFSRSSFREIPFPGSDLILDSICELEIFLSGVFEFYTQCTNENGETTTCPSAHFVVDPKLLLPSNVTPNFSLALPQQPQNDAEIQPSVIHDILLQIDSIQILTVIPKVHNSNPVDALH
jgi:N-terminal domain from the human glycogen debranching enzyme